MQQHRTTDKFPTLDELYLPDQRQLAYVIVEASGTRPKEIRDLHAAAACLEISDSVPDDIAAQFNTARELFVLSWHNLRFAQIAERHAYSTVEMALRDRLATQLEARKAQWKAKQKALPLQANRRPKENPTPPRVLLSSLLQLAVDEKLLDDKGFRQYQRLCAEHREYHDSIREIFPGDPHRCPPPPTKDAYVKTVSQTIPALRNHLAHGSKDMYPGICLQLEICCDILNQLYP